MRGSVRVPCTRGSKWTVCTKTATATYDEDEDEGDEGDDKDGDDGKACAADEIEDEDEVEEEEKEEAVGGALLANLTVNACLPCTIHSEVL